MTRLGMDLGIHDEGAGPKDPKEALNQAIQRFILVLVHAAQCRDRTCKSPSCAKMKRIMHHVGRCKQCVVCKQFLNLCLQHAKTCKSSNCPVPLCANIKKHLQEKQRQASFQESRFAARRMLAMRSAMPSSSSSSASNSNASSNAAAATAVQSPAPSTPARQQPGTPQQPPQVTNSPAPSPAVGRNPPSIPPPSVSHQSPGGKALGALQQSQDAQQTHGPPSIPSKPMNAAAPSPHSAATVSYQSPGGPPSVGKPPGREQIMNIRKNPQQAMDAIAQLAPQPTAYSGQPQVPGVRPVTNPTNRYATHMTPSAQPYPAHHHQGYMDGSTGANMVSSYTTARYPQHPQQRMVSTHPSYVHQQPVGHMYPQGGQTAYGQPTMGSQAMYNQRVMMAQSARPMYSGEWSDAAEPLLLYRAAAATDNVAASATNGRPTHQHAPHGGRGGYECSPPASTPAEISRCSWRPSNGRNLPTAATADVPHKCNATSARASSASPWRPDTQHRLPPGAISTRLLKC